LSYLEQGGSKRFLAPIISHFGTTPLAQIDQSALDRGANKLYPKASPATRNRQFFTPASSVLHHAARRGWCAAPIIERPDQGEERVRWLTPEEAERLIEACSPHLRPLVLFLLYTGARAGEALWLDWRSVDLSRVHVSFAKTKNGKARGVPLHPRVVAALANLPHREGDVFRKPDGRPYARPTRSDDTSAGTRIKTAFNAACRRAGIDDFSPHDCRHTWATWHYAKNRNIAALMTLGGWQSIRMVMRYAHVNVDEFAATIERLPGGNLGETETAKENVA
jgi:integrase